MTSPNSMCHTQGHVSVATCPFQSSDPLLPPWSLFPEARDDCGKVLASVHRLLSSGNPEEDSGENHCRENMWSLSGGIFER